MRDLSLCFFSFFTFWVTSWKSAREANTSRPLCFTTGFPGAPNGPTPQHSSICSNSVHRLGESALGNPFGISTFRTASTTTSLTIVITFYKNAKTSVASLRRLITPTRNADHDQPGTLITFIGIRTGIELLLLVRFVHEQDVRIR